MQKMIFSLLILALTFACSSHGNKPAGDASNFGTLSGHVTVGPLKPGPVSADEPEPAPPADLFAKHTIVILSETGSKKIREVQLDAKGFYEVVLPAGKYLVDIIPHDIGIKKQPPSPATVKPGQTTTVDLDFDTGMR